MWAASARLHAVANRVCGLKLGVRVVKSACGVWCVVMCVGRAPLPGRRFSPAPFLFFPAGVSSGAPVVFPPSCASYPSVLSSRCYALLRAPPGGPLLRRFVSASPLSRHSYRCPTVLSSVAAPAAMLSRLAPARCPSITRYVAFLLRVPRRFVSSYVSTSVLWRATPSARLSPLLAVSHPSN